jgi:hypothetical protein
MNLQVYKGISKQGGGLTKRALDGWDGKRQCACSGRCSPEAHSPDLRHFRALSTPKQNPALEVLSTPTHPQVTQAVSLFTFGGFNEC